ncbi:hypothetical protein [Treponema sp. R6D11]
MANKRFWLGILVMTLVFGMAVVGSAFGQKRNYYNLGDVSEKNCALIEVSPVNGKESDYPYSNFIKIDGQGGEQWQPPPKGFFDLGKANALVRVTPGVHTFTITFYYNYENNKYEVPLDITYDCKAGKAYTFDFWAENPYKVDGIGLSVGFVNTTILINEYSVDKKGNFGGLASTSSVVERKRESLNFNNNSIPNDRGRLVKRVD